MISAEKVIDAVRPCLTELEELRAEYFRKKREYWKTAALVLLIGAVIGVILGLIIPVVGFFITAIIVLIVLGVMWGSMVGGTKGDYVMTYKKKVVPEIIKQFDPSLTYNLEQGVSIDEFMESELHSSPDRYSAEDLITGNYGETRVLFSEVRAQQKRTRTDSKGNRKTYYVTTFSGIHFTADFHKHFQGRTFILNDFAENTFGGFGRKFQKLVKKRGTKLMHMDDPDFEREFAIYSTDEVECRYLLSNSMMRNMLKMRERIGARALSMSLKNSMLNIAISYNEMSFLEPTIEKPALDEGQISGFVTEIASILQIVEDINLNTRIWSKQ